MSEPATQFTPTFPDLSRVPAVDEVGVNERVARFQTRSIKTAAKVDALKLILSMIDLTTLEGQDTPGKVRQLCQKAMHLHDAMPGLPHVAAVCVYPTMVAVARQTLLPNLEAQARTLGVQDRVTFTGALAREDSCLAVSLTSVPAARAASSRWT